MTREYDCSMELRMPEEYVNIDGLDFWTHGDGRNGPERLETDLGAKWSEGRRDLNLSTCLFL